MDEVLLKDLRPGCVPAGHRIIVYVFPSERTTKAGIVIPEEIAQKNDIKQVRAMVVSIGRTAWADTPGYSLKGPPVTRGEIVYIAKFAGYKFVGKDEREYRVINDLDITLIEENDYGYESRYR